MLKPKREELVKLIVQKAGLPSDGSYIDYLTRQQLLELHSFLDVKSDKLELAVKLIKNIQAICEVCNERVDTNEQTNERIKELINEVHEILDIENNDNNEKG